jgi:hypothetical protein
VTFAPQHTCALDDITVAFAKLLEQQAGALVVSHEAFFSGMVGATSASMRVVF